MSNEYNGELIELTNELETKVMEIIELQSGLQEQVTESREVVISALKSCDEIIDTLKPVEEDVSEENSNSNSGLEFQIKRTDAELS
jgi:hypothetical protein